MNPPTKHPQPSTGSFLHDNLRKHRACTELLLATLEQEREALLANDIEALERLAVTKATAAQTLKDLGVLLTSIRTRSRAPNMVSLMTQIADPPGLFDEWQQLLALATRCQHANQENAALLDARQAQVRSALRLIQGTAPPVTYGRSGSAAAGLGTRNLGTA